MKYIFDKNWFIPAYKKEVAPILKKVVIIILK